MVYGPVPGIRSATVWRSEVYADLTQVGSQKSSNRQNDSCKDVIRFESRYALALPKRN